MFMQALSGLGRRRLPLHFPEPFERLQPLVSQNEGADDEEESHDPHQQIPYERLALDAAGENLSQEDAQNAEEAQSLFWE